MPPMGFLISILLMFPAFAGQYDWQKEKFMMNVPKDWQMMENFFGVPVTFLAPQVGNVRSIIQVIPTKAKPLKMDEKELTSFNKKYPKDKEEWLKKRHGKLLSLLSGELEAFGKSKAIVAGTSFTLGENSYTEKAFFFNCPGSLYELKLLVPYGKKDELSKAEKVLRSFKCGE